MVKAALVLLALAACDIPDVHFTGGTGGDDDGNPDSGSSQYQLSAAWQLGNLGQMAPRSCPANAQSANLLAQSWDPQTRQTRTDGVSAALKCSDGHGTLTLTDPTYLVGMTILDDAGVKLGNTELIFVDVKQLSGTVQLHFYEDANYLGASWFLYDSSKATSVRCADAGITGQGWIELQAVNVLSGDSITDKFPCDNHWSTSRPLTFGTYDVSVVGKNASGVAVTDVATTTTAVNRSGITLLGDAKLTLLPR